MMEWYLICSYLFTNELRLILGLCLAGRLMDFTLNKKALLITVLGGCIVTALQASSVPDAGIMAVEILIAWAVLGYILKKQIRLCLFLIFFYELGIGLWDFLFSAGLDILFYGKGLTGIAAEFPTGIWLVRLLMAGIALFLSVRKPGTQSFVMHLASVMAILGLFGSLTLSEQTILPLDEDKTGTWVILSMVLLFAIMYYRVNRQREMETEIAKLKQEQAEILERDYRKLSRTYADNAKLYHDMHNHIETIYHCLKKGGIQEALQYCEDMQISVREISQAVWTGDKAIDYLIGSKMALAEQKNIQVRVNIEYPHNTNIRSVDLAAVLGNLLDNALEAAEAAPACLRFLKLTLRRINDMLIIKVENGYGKAPAQQEGSLLTSKTDKMFHGWGLKSVQSAVEHYDGTVRTEYENGVFRCVVTLSFQPVPTLSSTL